MDKDGGFFSLLHRTMFGAHNRLASRLWGVCVVLLHCSTYLADNPVRASTSGVSLAAELTRGDTS